MSAEEVLNKETKQRKLLALDGGGIRGMVAIGVLERMEEHLKERLGRQGDDNFRLCDYFDYIAGTSTGAIIAACLAWGMSVREIRYFYEEKGSLMFEYGFWPRLIMKRFPIPSWRQSLVQLFPSAYNPENLRQSLQDIFQEDDGQPATLGSQKLKTLLLMMLRNATTDSPWPVSNNPQAKYNDRTREDSNLKYPLWQLIRASTAAPTFFPPEQFKISQKRPPHVFVDGAVTTYNDPAFQLFLMATVDRYKLQWPTGADKMLLVSIGTGIVPDANQYLKAQEMNFLYNVQKIPLALMLAAQIQQDFLCRVFGECLAGDPIDREVGDMIGSVGALEQKLFTYLRYNAELTEEGLSKLGLPNLDIAQVQRIDSVDSIDDLHAIGEAIAEHQMKPEHFDRFIPDSTVGDVVDLGEKRNSWQERLELAQKANPPQIGDLLILAEEAPVEAWQADAWIKAGIALTQAQRYKFALEQLDRGLAIDPDHLQGLQKKVICLQQLGNEAMDSLSQSEGQRQPKQVFLFSGHMVDEEGRNPPRFPNDKSAIAAQKIEAALLQMDAGTDDLALTQGACGGDLLFTEACQKLGVKVQWLQPFDEPEFIRRSVARGGGNWCDRYDRVKEKLTLPIRWAPQSLGLPPSSLGNSYPYERCNLWLLYTALSYGIEKVRFICLWDGENGARPGGTAHMYQEVKNRTGQVKHINTRLL